MLSVDLAQCAPLQSKYKTIYDKKFISIEFTLIFRNPEIEKFAENMK